MPFVNNHLGELFALCTAIFWTITALAFESASLKVGSVATNIIRLILGLIFLSIFAAFSRGMFFPLDASRHNWFWLILSGLVGFVFGDLLLFKSFTLIGSRFAMLIMALAPPMAAFFGWLFLGEHLGIFGLFGMILTLGGISMAILGRDEKKTKLKLKLAPTGILFALGGALGQALGLVISKIGMQGYDSFASTQIRIIGAIAGFALLITIMGRWSDIYDALFHLKAMRGIAIGSFFGPFLGVGFSLMAITKTETGIAATIMSLVPILIIPPTIIFFRQKVTWTELLGAIISIIGVAMFFIK